MDDLMGLIFLAASVVIFIYFILNGRRIYQRSRDREIRERFGRSFCDFLRGMAYMHFTVAAIPAIIVIIIFLSALRDEGRGGELPVFVAVLVYAVVCVAAVWGHRLWWNRIAETEIINGGSSNNHEER